MYLINLIESCEKSDFVLHGMILFEIC